MKADVVIPVYRDVKVTRACIEAVLEHSGPSLRRLILVDDCGPEREMRPLLRRYRAADARVRLLENESNRGFVSSANRGLSLRQGHAVILNSDTRVTAGWLEELLTVLSSQERLAAVVPLSNNAGLASVPTFGVATRADAVDPTQFDLSTLPRMTPVSTGVGFCMLLAGPALDAIGLFDPAYGRGYNEENDWCQRAQAQGFLIGRANRAFVFHVGQVSFGSERGELDVRNGRRLVKRYPHYIAQQQHFETGATARSAAIAVSAQLKPLSVCIDLKYAGAQEALGAEPEGLSLARVLVAQKDIAVTVRVANDQLKHAVTSTGASVIGPHVPLTGFDVVHLVAPLTSMSQAADALESDALLVSSWSRAEQSTPVDGASWATHEERLAARWALLHASQAVVTPTRALAKELIAAEPALRRRVHTVLPGIEADRLATDELVALFKQRHALHHYAVCPLSENASPMLALEAWALLQARGGVVPELVFVGTRPTNTALPAGARWLSAIAADELAALLRGAAFVLKPAGQELSRYGLGALAHGVPLIVCGQTHEVLEDAGLALDAPTPSHIADACRRVLDEPELRAQLIDRGLARAERLSMRAVGAATAALYRALVRAPDNTSLEARTPLRSLVTRAARTALDPLEPLP